MPTIDFLRDLWKQIRSYLVVTHAITAKTGDYINVHEDFTMKLTVRNNAPSGPMYPHLRFKNIRLFLSGTPYASLAVGQPSIVDVPGVLGPGESAPPVNVKMVAQQAADTAEPERVLRVRVTAALDVNSLSGPVVLDSMQVEQVYPEVQEVYP